MIFAGLHLANPGVLKDGWAGLGLVAVNIFLAGVWLGAAMLCSGDLWLPTGLHL